MTDKLVSSAINERGSGTVSAAGERLCVEDYVWSCIDDTRRAILREYARSLGVSLVIVTPRSPAKPSQTETPPSNADEKGPSNDYR